MEEIDSQTIPLKEASNSANAIQKKSSGAATNSRPLQPQQQARRLQHRCIYILFLLLALYMIERSTGTRVFIIIQQHEPSIRIFRCLFEVFVLLLATAASVHVYGQYLGEHHVERLLFYPPPNNNNKDYRTEEELSEVEIQFRDYDESDVFDVVDEEDIVEYLGDIHNHKPSRHDDEKSTKEAMIKVTKDDLLKLQPSKWVPSPSAILGSALDLFIWLLVTLVLYTVAAIGAADETVDERSYWWALLSSLAAPTFPLMLFLFTAFKAFFPWRNRRMLFRVISFTWQAPWHEVSFRDGMIGDIMTSMVRPMQDIAFTIFYLLFGLNQWWYLRSTAASAATDHASFDDGAAATTITSNFVNAADANVPAMEKSWLLHTLILPACAISPLWYRFLQNVCITKLPFPFLLTNMASLPATYRN
jgi:EXS family